MTIPAPTPSPKDASPDSDLTAANDGASREGRAPKGDAVVEAVGGVDKKAEEGDRPMDAGEAPTPALATVFRIRLKQPSSSLRHKKNVPDLCRNFSAVAWCGKLNAIACASETCARIPSIEITYGRFAILDTDHRVKLAMVKFAIQSPILHFGFRYTLSTLNDLRNVLSSMSKLILQVILSGLLNGLLGPAVVPYWWEIYREGSQYGLSPVKSVDYVHSAIFGSILQLQEALQCQI
ncbi:hypothetical protein ZIOFF_056598 [Zingiber officinale]|uniref:Uncharacterized protein n=1 Tax=Zingiber officinale TaxID=94328 RepID=A0A8J5FI45_ZINOF|nr:hypothetical protein ZIOFF_056598 [Zingiber officinale]